MLIEKAATILLTVGLMRKTQNKSVKTEIVRSIELGAKIELDLSNYAKKQI